MSSKTEHYRRHLRSLSDWTSYLRAESGLPGPRGNLELAQAVAEEATPRQVESLLSIPMEQAPENSKGVFLVFCGITALGKRLAAGNRSQLQRLRAYASDPRWRVREAVAIALQYFGDADIQGLLREMRRWAAGNWYEQRAAAAALCEPRLLHDAKVAGGLLEILDGITRDIAGKPDSSEAFKTLRKSMGYCWSVAIAASPQAGKSLFEKWIRSPSRDVRWLLKQNLSKKRLQQVDSAWVADCLTRLAA
ncbi:MAG: HEAT repeat domain-containing protein [Anaerolineae bacterium]